MSTDLSGKLIDLSYEADKIAEMLDDSLPREVTKPDDADVPDHLEGYIEDLWGCIEDLQEIIREAKKKVAS